MRPSISLSPETDSEQSVPWGRDLFTFVTSAAGHMMRTLQKPRKNRPSKRQVNHRRFLHNMIQRKFADIEAANHRLASALYYKDEEETTLKNQPADKSINQKRADDVSVESDQYEDTHVQEKPQPDICSTVKSNQVKGQRKRRSGCDELLEFTSISSLIESEHNGGSEVDQNTLSSVEDHLADPSQQESDVPNMDTPPSFSPDLSPLSLNSCDFSFPMFPDVSAQKNDVSDVAENPWADIVDLLGVATKDLAGCVDAYFQSICSEVNSDFTAGCFSDGDRYDDGYGCHRNQESTINTAPETPLNLLISPSCSNVPRDLLPTSTCCFYTSTHENNPSFTLFEGAAQSFTAPLHPLELRPVLTPPHEQDWPFPDILKERAPPGC